ncbi:MAG: CAF17-like 4Fe-4S cluster assembly/insertion protein YgfZ [Planctomycetota bacterium]|jgi:folate-binding protein YgfZ
MSDVHRNFHTFLHSRYPDAAVTGTGLIESFTDVGQEHGALGQGVGVMHRIDRGLIALSGKDRTSWLQGMTTNHVATLDKGQGNYAFVCNVQGRIVADALVIPFADEIWLDVDRSSIEALTGHFRKFLIVEDVSIADRSDDSVRIGVIGPDASALLEIFGSGHIRNLPRYGSAIISVGDQQVTVVRTDSCGLPGYDLFVSPAAAEASWELLLSAHDGAIPVGCLAHDAWRIESGVPEFGKEITDEYLPAETGQLDRAVSLNKGCYLGQEVVARMHAHDAVARLLVGVKFPPDAKPLPGMEIRAGGRATGELTSVCHSISSACPIGLGYVKSAVAAAGTEVEVWGGDLRLNATIADLSPVKSM